MRRPVQIALFAALVLLLGAVSVLYVKYRDMSSAYATSKASEADSQVRYAKTIDAIAEIQDSLNAIALGDANVKLQTMGSEQRISGADKAEALDRIAVLRSSILRSKARIQQLESSLHSSGVKVAGLQRMLASLKKNVAEKEQMVASLSGRVDSLQTQVTGLATTVQEREDTLRVRDQTIEERRRDLATVYYVAGTKHDLTQKGVIVAKGGVLGIAKTVVPATGANPAAFTPLDTDQETTIDLNTAKAQVVSAQPAGSYELKLVDGKMQLHILNPVEFRKIKQVVIMTA